MSEGTFWGLVEQAVRQRPDAVVLADDYGRSLTTTALRDEAERAAAGLRALGVAAGDVVSWQLPTVLEAGVLTAACARLGAAQNPIIPVFRQREVSFVVQQVRARLVVDPSLDAEAFDDEGWFRTGDFGGIDDDGRVRVEGRLKEVVVRNAENISASEVENVLLQHPDVADVAVVGVPDERTGEHVCAVAVVAPGRQLTLADLVEHCRAVGLARYKAPEQLEIVGELPRNPMGKVLKRKLEARPAAGGRLSGGAVSGGAA